MEPSTPDDVQEAQQQPTEAVPLLLTARTSLAQIPAKIRLTVVAFPLYSWNVPLSRIALWMGVSPETGKAPIEQIMLHARQMPFS